MNKSQILDYLKIIFNLEKELYEITNVIESINNQLLKCENPNYLSLQSVPQKPNKYNYVNSLKDTFGWIIENFADGIWLLLLFIIGLIWFVSYLMLGINPNINNPIILSIIISVIVPLFLVTVIITPIVTLVNSIKYKLEEKEYKSVAECITNNNKKITALNSHIANTNKIKIIKLTKEKKKLKETRTEIHNTLMKYYSLNIIYKDYREMPYIAMFIKYFDSGRCSQFEGHEGAYNLLEQDIKYNNFMNRMDDILYHLENIRSSNAVLYQGIMECNSNISKLSNTIINSANSIEQRISRGVDITNEKLASIEYSNYLIANNTQYLSDLKTFEMLMK